MRARRMLFVLACGLPPAMALACGSSSGGGGTSPPAEAGPQDSPSSPEGGATPEGSTADTGSSLDSSEDVTAAQDSGGGVHNGPCCVQNASYDSQCTARGEPPMAYVCFCPDGGIDPACTINMGTELVCCP